MSAMNNIGIVKRNIVRADKAAVEKLSRYARNGTICVGHVLRPASNFEWRALPERMLMGCMAYSTGTTW